MLWTQMVLIYCSCASSTHRLYKGPVQRGCAWQTWTPCQNMPIHIYHLTIIPHTRTHDNLQFLCSIIGFAAAFNQLECLCLNLSRAAVHQEVIIHSIAFISVQWRFDVNAAQLWDPGHMLPSSGQSSQDTQADGCAWYMSFISHWQCIRMIFHFQNYFCLKYNFGNSVENEEKICRFSSLSINNVSWRLCFYFGLYIHIIYIYYITVNTTTLIYAYLIFLKGNLYYNNVNLKLPLRIMRISHTSPVD